MATQMTVPARDVWTRAIDALRVWENRRDAARDKHSAEQRRYDALPFWKAIFVLDPDHYLKMDGYDYPSTADRDRLYNLAVMAKGQPHSVLLDVDDDALIRRYE